MPILENANLVSREALPSPAELKTRLPVPEGVAGTVLAARAHLRHALHGRDARCSSVRAIQPVR